MVLKVLKPKQKNVLYLCAYSNLCLIMALSTSILHPQDNKSSTFDIIQSGAKSLGHVAYIVNPHIYMRQAYKLNKVLKLQ